MKIEEAIQNHKNWKLKISDYINRSDVKLTPDKCHERCCELTQWLTSDEAVNLLSRNELHELQKSHKAFHHTIAELVLNVNRGVDISEEMALGLDSIFHRHSESVMKILNKVEERKTSKAA